VLQTSLALELESAFDRARAVDAPLADRDLNSRGSEDDSATQCKSNLKRVRKKLRAPISSIRTKKFFIQSRHPHIRP